MYLVNIYNQYYVFYQDNKLTGKFETKQEALDFAELILGESAVVDYLITYEMNL